MLIASDGSIVASARSGGADDGVPVVERLTAANGQPVWQGPVVADGVVFNVPVTAFAPSTREEKHRLWGTTLRTTRDTGWNASAVFSQYRILEDFTLQANNPDPVAAGGGPGTNSERDGTGWQTFELQGVFTPSEGDWTNGAHTLAFGYHRNDYTLDSPTYNTTDWRSRTGTLARSTSTAGAETFSNS